MLGKITGCCVVGIDGNMIEVEVDVARGLPNFSVVGLPDSSIRESRDRVKSAIKNCGYEFPARRITVNLAPADIKKEGPGFDLPIALGILLASGFFSPAVSYRFCAVGELSLDGSLRRVKGILPMILAARESGFEEILVPQENLSELKLVPEGIRIIPVQSLPQTLEYLVGLQEISSCIPGILENRDAEVSSLDFADVKGHQQVKRALEIAACGNHNFLLQGPPGSGKTMLARRLVSILPEMSMGELLETTKIYSVSDKAWSMASQLGQRPFRAPHHTISDAGLIGGGSIPQPGEVSLAHNGVLFLDELPEFKKSVLEVLRQPIEDGTVTIARANMTLTFPARFLLAVALNPCPCGFRGDARNRCRCTEHEVRRYIGKMSGPLLDRVDIHLEVPALEVSELRSTAQGEPSTHIKKRVDEVRAIQQERFKDYPGVYCNSQMTSRLVEKYCIIDAKSAKILELSMQRLGLSARAYHRILKLARTIADMGGSSSIIASHIAEAVQLCRLHGKQLP